MTDTQTTHRLADVHRRFLLDHAIDPRDYPEGDLYTADRPDSLPPRIDCPTPALVFALCVLSSCYRPVWREFSFRKSGRF